MTQEITQQPSTEEASHAGLLVAVSGLRFEHFQDALGTGNPRPRLSWLVDTALPGWMQAAYELEAKGPDGQMQGAGRV